MVRRASTARNRVMPRSEDRSIRCSWSSSDVRNVVMSRNGSEIVVASGRKSIRAGRRVNVSLPSSGRGRAGGNVDWRDRAGGVGDE